MTRAALYLRAVSVDDAAGAREALRAAAAPLGWAIVEEPSAGTIPTDALRAVLAHWPAADGAVVTARELVEHAAASGPWRRAILAWCPPRGGHELPTPRSVGCKLRGVRRVVVDGHVVDVATREKGGRAWVRQRVAGGD